MGGAGWNVRLLRRAVVASPFSQGALERDATVPCVPVRFVSPWDIERDGHSRPLSACSLLCFPFGSPLSRCCEEDEA